MNKSTSAKNGTYYDLNKEVGDLKYAGYSVKDSVCVGTKATPCINDFEFFVINNDTEQRSALQRCDGIMGLAPDNDDNGPSYMTSLRNLSLISKLQVSMLMQSMNGGKSKMTFGGYDKADLKPFPTAKEPKIYWYDNRFDEKEWGTEMRRMMLGDVPLDNTTTGQIYAKIDSFSPYIQIPGTYFDVFENYMKANHTEMTCTSISHEFGICYATNMTCDSIMSKYANFTIRFNDSMGFVVPPKSYLKNDKTASGIPMCYHMVIMSSLNPNIVVLGDTFIENYMVIYDFENTTIGLNGWAFEDLPIEPPRPSTPSDKTTMIVIIIAVCIIALAGAGAAVVLIKKRNAKLSSNLQSYDKLAESDVYQKPQIYKSDRLN